MFTIAFSLLGAWVLNWFGFSDLVAYGFNHFFGVEITTTGYYFLFVILAVIKIILNNFRPVRVINKEG